jgi:hypothetical protein
VLYETTEIDLIFYITKPIEKVLNILEPQEAVYFNGRKENSICQ